MQSSRVHFFTCPEIDWTNKTKSSDIIIKILLI
jgi:hypothetical protein